MYDITVKTIVTKATGELFWQDEMQWFSVDNEIKGWLADSCKTALFKMIGVPEVVSGKAYNLYYQTIVKQGDRVISDTSLVEFPNLSYETIVEFQAFALQELKEMLNLMRKKHTQASIVEKPRSKIKTLFTLARSKYGF